LWICLELSEEYVDTWKSYIEFLKLYNIILNDDEDEILWSPNPFRRCDPKIGYKALSMEGNDQPPLLWWKSIWKFIFFIKAKNL
jgi:hypothetical protein